MNLLCSLTQQENIEGMKLYSGTISSTVGVAHRTSSVAMVCSKRCLTILVCM